MARAIEIINLAAGELGVTEYPPGSNNVKYNTAYYGGPVHGGGYAWCCAFVWWLFQRVDPSLFYGGGRTAYCPAVEAYAKNHGQWVASGFRPGDCMLFDFSGAGIASHIGVLERMVNGTFICLEGNTSVTSNDNGGAVMRRTRYRNQIRGAFRPRYEEADDMLTYDQFKAYMAEYEAERAASAGYAEEQAAMAKAKAAGVMDGTRPDSPLTRGEYAITLQRRGALG